MATKKDLPADPKSLYGAKRIIASCRAGHTIDQEKLIAAAYTLLKWIEMNGN